MLNNTVWECNSVVTDLRCARLTSGQDAEAGAPQVGAVPQGAGWTPGADSNCSRQQLLRLTVTPNEPVGGRCSASSSEEGAVNASFKLRQSRERMDFD